MGELPPAIAHRIASIKDILAQLHRGGARIVPGTDAGLAPAKPHDVLPYGIAELTTWIGMTNLEALRAVTSLAAETCGSAAAKAGWYRG